MKSIVSTIDYPNVRNDQGPVSGAELTGGYTTEIKYEQALAVAIVSPNLIIRKLSVFINDCVATIIRYAESTLTGVIGIAEIVANGILVARFHCKQHHNNRFKVV